MRKWPACNIQDCGVGVHGPEGGAWVDVLYSGLKIRRCVPNFSCSGDKVDEALCLAVTESSERILSRSGTHRAFTLAQSWVARTIVDHGNPASGAWHGTSATAPATTAACANDAEVFDGLL